MIRSKVFILLLILPFVCIAQTPAQDEPAEKDAAAVISGDATPPASTGVESAPRKLSEQSKESVSVAENAEPQERPLSAPANIGLKAAAPAGIMEVEWKFLKTYGEDKDEDVAAAILVQLTDWLKLYPDSEYADEARLLKARLHLKLGDYKSAIVDLLKHTQEYPDSKFNADVRKLLNETIEKKIDKKTKPVLNEIATAPETGDKAERIALFLEKLADGAGEVFYVPAAAEFREFFSRFPLYAGRDGVQLVLGNLHSKKEEYLSARLAYERLIQVYPDSRFLLRAKSSLGGVLANNIKDYNAAIKVYQDIAANFPGTDEAWMAYRQLARLSEHQKQYPLAVDVYEKMITLYPDKTEVYTAFNSEARILRDEMSKPKEAVDVLGRLADKFKGGKAIDALYLAAEIARKDMKDLDTEIQMYDRIAADYPDNAQAPKAILTAGQAFEKNKNFDKAREYYTKITEKYPEDPLAKKAQKYFDSIAFK
ncbi:MAG: tetratricopeptide repeat protein [Elusimicrobia bacterium]|nr:tetratricopeptide repeat protein [Elusimicrobiota bacterium]